jgi:hypothetical protein
VEDGLTKADSRLTRFFEHLEERWPKLAGFIRWVRNPRAAWVRVPLGVLLCVGGVFSILPFLGAWMLPLGLVLLAVDLPLLRHPVTAFLIRARRWFSKLSRWWRDRRG